MTRTTKWAVPFVLFVATLATDARAYDVFTAAGGVATDFPFARTSARLDGNLAVYVGEEDIRFFNFATGEDDPIQSAAFVADGPSMSGLPDVSGTILVFNQEYLSYLPGLPVGHSSIYAFDTATYGPGFGIDLRGDSARYDVRIGGSTVAWQELWSQTDFAVPAYSGIVAYDLVSKVATPLHSANDLVDKAPSVSPDGNVIVWQGCRETPVFGPTGFEGYWESCDVWLSAKRSGVWSTPQVTNTSDAGNAGFAEESGLACSGSFDGPPSCQNRPDTNGVLVVYGDNRTGNATGPDIYWRPVDAGAESQLALEGDQQNPRIAGNVIAFEGRNSADPNPDWDIYLLDLSTSAIYRLTDTPDINEHLGDVTAEGTQARVAWSSVEAGAQVYTFDLCVALGGDADGDGVCDARDHCLGTAADATIDAQGCSEAQRDTDADGVANGLDACPNTPPNSIVDAAGCSAAQRDTDHDGVPDSVDACPGTAVGTPVNAVGCPIVQPGRVCDVDHDGDVDWRDIVAVTLAVGQKTSSATDPRDPNRNGRIELKDVVACATRCDRWLCASP